MIDVSSEWRDFGNDSDSPSKSRVGAAQSRLYDTANLETVIMGKISSSMSNESSLSKSNHRTSQVPISFPRKEILFSLTDSYSRHRRTKPYEQLMMLFEMLLHGLV